MSGFNSSLAYHYGVNYDDGNITSVANSTSERMGNMTTQSNDILKNIQFTVENVVSGSIAAIGIGINSVSIFMTTPNVLSSAVNGAFSVLSKWGIPGWVSTTVLGAIALFFVIEMFSWIRGSSMTRQE
jgi:hypothetical protein